VFLCSGIPTQLTIGAALAAVGITPTDVSGELSRTFVVALSLIDTALLVGLMTVLLREHGERPTDVWFGAGPSGREVRLGLLSVPPLVLGVGLLLNGLRWAAPQLQNVPTNPLEALADTLPSAVVLGLVAIVAGGVREELQRGFLLHRVERYLGGSTLGVIVLSAAFGLGHYVQGWDAVITTGVMGLFWAVMYVRRRSSLAPLVSHSAFNALEVVRVAVMGPT
jgi:uncharacterized protein